MIFFICAIENDGGKSINTNLDEVIEADNGLRAINRSKHLKEIGAPHIKEAHLNLDRMAVVYFNNDRAIYAIHAQARLSRIKKSQKEKE